MLFFYLIIIAIIVFGAAIYFMYIRPKQDPLNKAKELTALNKFNEAISEYKRILYAEPDSFEVHLKVAELYERLLNYEQVVFHLNEILRIDKYNLAVQKIKVLKSIALAYHHLDNIEKAFQTYFDILKVNNEDAESYYHIAFISLGQEEFEIAQKYFEKLVTLNDDFESFFGAGICSYQNNKNENAVSYFKEALSLKPASDIGALAVSFALSRTGGYSEAISYLTKLTGRVLEDDVMFIAKRFLSLLHIKAKKKEDCLKLLQQLLIFTKEKNMTDEYKLALYDAGFASVVNNMLDQAFKYWEQLYQADGDYRNIKELLNLVKKDINKGSKSDDFERSVFDYMDDWEANWFTDDFLWNICGLKSNRIIDIKNVVVPARVAKEKDQGKKNLSADGISGDSAERIDKFCGLDNESFRVISNRVVQKTGNKPDELLNTYKEADGVDLMAKSPDGNEKVLIWVRRWKGTNVGEITLRNFAQAINDIKAPKGILITTAELTQAAQNSLTKLNRVSVIPPEELGELLKGLI